MKSLIKILAKKKLKISVVESCTGGLLASKITSTSGASKVFNLGFVTYSNQAKIEILKVNKNIIRKYGAVSHQCCLAMVKNLHKLSKSKICISTTGVAGPKGGSLKKPVGLVYIGVKMNKKNLIKKFLIKNNGREFIQKQTVKETLKILTQLF